VTTPETLPDNVAGLRTLVLAAWAEREAERAEKVRLIVFCWHLPSLAAGKT
jgi:hypothetical protein